MRRSVLLFALAGCGYPAEDFRADYVASYCAWGADCHWYESVALCEAAYVDWAPADETCFDPKAARDCVDALDALACPLVEESVEFPDACNAVYVCESE